MATSSFSKQDVQELRKMVRDMQETLRTLRFSGAGSRSRNTREARNVRREIARIKTELRSREISATT